MSNVDWIVMAALDVVAVAGILRVLARRGLGRGPTAVAAGLAVGWLSLLTAGFAGRLVPDSLGAGGFITLVVLAVAGVGAALRGPGLGPSVARLTDADLLALQGVRVGFGATFFAQAFTGALPQAFGILDGMTHMTAGTLGLAAAAVLRRDPDATALPWAANLFGLVDIVVVLSSLSFVLIPSTGLHHPMMLAVFLPAPFWAWWHLISMSRLARRGPRPETAGRKLSGEAH